MGERRNSSAERRIGFSGAFVESQDDSTFEKFALRGGSKRRLPEIPSANPRPDLADVMDGLDYESAQSIQSIPATPRRRSTMDSAESRRLAAKRRTQPFEITAPLFACPHSKYLICRECYDAERPTHPNYNQANVQERRRSSSSMAIAPPPRGADWERRTPGKIHEQLVDRLLTMPESEDFERQRNFLIDPKEGLIDCGDCFRRRPDSPLPVEELGTTPSPQEELEEMNQVSVLLIGSDCTGKTSLINQFVSLEAERNSFAVTEEAEPVQSRVVVMLQGEQYNVSLTEIHFNPEVKQGWESNLTPYDGFIVVYAVPTRSTFDDAVEILQILSDDATKTGVVKPIIIVGNKCDLARQHSVQPNEARNVAEHFGCKFVEVSTVLNHNTALLLAGIVEQVRIRRAGIPVRKSPSLCPEEMAEEDPNEVEEKKHKPTGCANIAALGHMLMEKLHLPTNIGVNAV